MPPFRRLVIESTGLADPFPILSTVRSDPVLRHHFCLGPVITTVDAVNGARQLDMQPESVNQVAVADRLLLTKTDLASAEAATRLVKRLRQINSAAPLWRAAEDDIDVGILLSGDYQELWQLAEAGELTAARQTVADPVKAAAEAVVIVEQYGQDGEITRDEFMRYGLHAATGYCLRSLELCRENRPPS